MYNILIVDDEVLVRTHLKLLLQNLSNEFTVCGEATNGLSALEKIPRIQPDIIFSDMRMPVMDGLELCRQVKNQYPDIQIIALSNYDDYTYVRGALKNGALDYVLKHKLNEEYLLSLLTELKKNLNVQSGLKSFPNRTVSALREKFVNDLLGEVFLSEKDIETNIRFLGINLDLTHLIPIILSVDDYARIEQQNNLNQKNILNFSICNIGNEILSKYPTGILAHIEKEIYCILLSFASEVSQAKIEGTINSLLQQISSNYKKYLNISVSFCVGETTGHIIDISHSYTRALETIRLTFYSDRQSILRTKSVPIPPSDLAGLDYSLEKSLLSLAQKGDYEKAEEIIQKLFQNMADQKENRSSVQMKCTDLLSIITRISKKNKLDLNKIIADKISPDQIFIQFHTMAQFSEWFLDCFLNMCREIKLQLPGDSSYVKSAIAYVNRDYSKPISLQSIADEIGISIGYLSTIFKNETGHGFTDYLNSLRISTAVHLMELGERDFHKIAEECGFQDYAYFFKVFKKRMGTTPKTYLRRFE
ncbi:response regulator [Lacrimispora sp. 38-1]|uniref:response regulator n=1 Tax=Lacrimispora sp. 38-1 TaxID=3125778 RepID=UPI003CE8A44B